MKKRPFLMALLVMGAIFLFFLVLILVAASLSGGRGGRLPLGEKVGVVEVQGAILASEAIIDDLITFRDNDSVKAIVLRIDSPGGGVAPSQEIHEEVARTVQSKPVVVSMGSVAASGGYYIAAPSSRIVANPGSLTGSIGVIMEFTNFQQLMEKVGLYNEVVKSGKHKDIGSPVRPMTAEDRALLQGVIDDVHTQFVDAVASGRKLPREEVVPLADGRIYTGRQARDLGLVDELGNLEDAVRLAASLGGIEGEPDVVYPAEEGPRVFDYLIEQAAEAFQRGLRDESHGLQYRWPGVH